MKPAETAATAVRPEAAHDALVVDQRRVASRLRPGAAWTVACAGVDVSMLLLAAGATELGGRLGGSRTPSVVWMAGFTAVALIVYASRGLYAPRLRLRLLDDMGRLLVSTGLAGTVVVTAQVVIEGSVPVALGVLRLCGFACVYVAAGRVALYWSRERARAEGESTRPTLIV